MKEWFLLTVEWCHGGSCTARWRCGAVLLLINSSRRRWRFFLCVTRLVYVPTSSPFSASTARCRRAAAVWGCCSGVLDCCLLTVPRLRHLWQLLLAGTEGGRWLPGASDGCRAEPGAPRTTPTLLGVSVAEISAASHYLKMSPRFLSLRLVLVSLVCPT